LVSFSLIFSSFSPLSSLDFVPSFSLNLVHSFFSFSKTRMVFQKKKKMVLERFLPSFHNLPRKRGSSSFCHLVGSIWSRESSHKVSQSKEFFFFSHSWLSVLL
jgi:hypothetical protein